MIHHIKAFMFLEEVVIFLPMFYSVKSPIQA
jgi:hypothetical protein